MRQPAALRENLKVLQLGRWNLYHGSPADALPHCAYSRSVHGACRRTACLHCLPWLPHPDAKVLSRFSPSSAFFEFPGVNVVDIHLEYAEALSAADGRVEECVDVWVQAMALADSNMAVLKRAAATTRSADALMALLRRLHVTQRTKFSVVLPAALGNIECDTAADLLIREMRKTAGVSVHVMRSIRGRQRVCVCVCVCHTFMCLCRPPTRRPKSCNFDKAGT